MGIDEQVEPSGGAFRQRVSAWAAAARTNDSFFVPVTMFLFVVTGTMVAMHGTYYAENIRDGLAFGGAIVGVFVPAIVCTVLALLWPRWPRKWWIVAAVVTGLICLFFALLPSVTAGKGWLSVLLFTLISAAYDAFVVAYALVVQPWRWMPGFNTPSDQD